MFMESQSYSQSQPLMSGPMMRPMTSSPYTEDSFVQQTTADYLEQQFGQEFYLHKVYV